MKDVREWYRKTPVQVFGARVIESKQRKESRDVHYDIQPIKTIRYILKNVLRKRTLYANKFKGP